MFIDGKEVNIKTGDKLRVTSYTEATLPPFMGFGLKFKKIILRELSSAAREFLDVLSDKRSINTNEAIYIPRDGSAKTKASKAYRELKKHEMVIRVRKQTYLLNPAAVIPNRKYFNQVTEEWIKNV